MFIERQRERGKERKSERDQHHPPLEESRATVSSQGPHHDMNISIHIYILYIYMYLYIYTEREREREKETTIAPL